MANPKAGAINFFKPGTEPHPHTRSPTRPTPRAARLNKKPKQKAYKQALPQGIPSRLTVTAKCAQPIHAAPTDVREAEGRHYPVQFNHQSESPVGEEEGSNVGC